MATILVIDDEIELVKLVQIRLEANDHDVLTANDALQGTTLAHKEQPDLIILDLIMPLGGGLETLRNLRKSQHTKHIPVIVMSGTGDKQLREEVYRIGVAAYMQKPYDANDLLAKIKEILPEEEF